MVNTGYLKDYRLDLLKVLMAGLVGIRWRGNHDSICKGIFSGKWLIEPTFTFRDKL